MEIYYGAEKTVDFYDKKYGRKSFDNKGTKITAHGSKSGQNAFWTEDRSGKGTCYFDIGSALTCLDVVGHEITHGVTGATAGLIYSYESGALNEAFSDIFGFCIERDTTGKENWVIGHCTTFLKRDMSNPKSTGYPACVGGTNWVTGSADNGGVHTNSQVQTHIFYMLAKG